MQVRIVNGLLVSLLISQCNANDVVPISNYSISIKDYASNFSSNLIKLMKASEESARSTWTAYHRRNKIINSDFHHFLDKYAESIPNDLLETLESAKKHLMITSELFEDGLKRYQNFLYAKKNTSSDSKDTLQSNAIFDPTKIELNSQELLQLSDYGFAWNASFEFQDEWRPEKKGLLKLPQILNATFFDKVMALEDPHKGELQQHLFDILLKNVQYDSAIYYTFMNVCFELLGNIAAPYRDLIDNDPKNPTSKILDLYRNFAILIKKQIKTLSRDFYASSTSEVDPSDFIHLKAFQKYLFTEDQIRPGYICDKKCSAVNSMSNVNDSIVCYDKSYNYYDNNEICLKTKKCKKLHCSSEQDEKDLSHYQVCVNGNSTDDRYQYYHKENSANGTKCFGSLMVLSPSRRARNNDDRCKVCDCTCFDNDYYVSLKPALVDENMVVVGARFKLLNNTLHIELRQAKVLSNGQIDNSTASWKVMNASSNSYHSLHFDRVKIDWQNLRAIDLTDNIVPEGHLLTGLKFEKITDKNAKDSVKKHRIALSIHATEYDFAQGQLDDDGDWQTPRISKTELPLLGENLPRKSSKYRRVSTSDEYVMLTTSGSIEDGGQSTIPFIDNRDVTLQTPTPLSGAGLVYSSEDGSGGFVGLKLIAAYGVSPQINAA